MSKHTSSHSEIGPAGCSAAFTLIELLVVIGIVGLLLGILLPSLMGARAATRTAVCVANVRQMAIALELYTEEENGRIFPVKEVVDAEGVLWWFGLEPADGPRREGERRLLRTRGRLWPYYRRTDSIEVCPSFAVSSRHYKPKFATNWTTYGLPLPLMSPHESTRIGEVDRPDQTVAFVDSAQINAFQAPASPTNPMFEQWYYVSRLEQTVYYVHAGRASAAMFDGHVRMLDSEFGVNTFFPEAPVGRPPSDVILNVK